MQLKLKQKTVPPILNSSIPKKQTKQKQLKYTQNKTRHILELTQQNETCRNNQPEIIQKIKLIKKDQDSSSDKKTWTDKYFSCFAVLCQRLVPKKKSLKQMDVNQSQFTQLISKIRNKKAVYQVVLPPQKQFKKTLVLDLDETLIHTTFNKPSKFDFQTQILFNGKITVVYTIKRFGLDAFLFQMSRMYELVIFTASQKQYADKIIDQIDPKHRISHRLYRDHCIIVNKVYYLKNLKILGRDLKNVVLIDDNKMAGVLQPQNFYRVQQFLGNSKDRKLFQLGNFLKHLNQAKYMIPIVQSHKKYEQIQIKIKQQSSREEAYKKSIGDKKRQYRHRKTNSQVESLSAQLQKEQIQQEQEPTGTDLIKRECD